MMSLVMIMNSHLGAVQILCGTQEVSLHCLQNLSSEADRLACRYSRATSLDAKRKQSNDCGGRSHHSHSDYNQKRLQ